MRVLSTIAWLLMRWFSLVCYVCLWSSFQWFTNSSFVELILSWAFILKLDLNSLYDSYCLCWAYPCLTLQSSGFALLACIGNLTASLLAAFVYLQPCYSYDDFFCFYLCFELSCCVWLLVKTAIVHIWVYYVCIFMSCFLWIFVVLFFLFL